MPPSTPRPFSATAGPLRRRTVGTLLVLFLQACVYLPRTTEIYDSHCRILSRHMTLEPVQIGGFFGCSNADCALLLAAYGATAAASAVVSGSIVVVGNIAYWFEKQGNCRKEN